VHSVQGIDRTLRYFINPAEKHGCPGGHPHFLCLRCRGMSCLSDQGIAVVRVPPGAEVRGKQLLVYGVCPSCASSNRARTAPRYAADSAPREGSARLRARPEGRTRSASTPYAADSAKRSNRGGAR
jgi:hypothetical protein